MSFTPGQTLSGAELQNKWTDAFNYVNVGLSSDDFVSGSLISEDLGRGDFIAVVPDHLFQSGDHLSNGKARNIEIPNDLTYFTATVKTFYPRDTQENISVAGVSRSVYFEKVGKALVTITAWVSDEDNANARAVVSQGSATLNTTTSVAVNSRWLLSIDGVSIPSTVCHSFEEDSGGTATDTSVASGFSSSLAAFRRRRKRIHITYLAGALSEGWHTFGLVTDTRNEISKLGNFNISVECFYQTGLEEADVRNLPLTVKLRQNNF